MENPEKDLRLRELAEIEKMRNLEIMRFDDEIDEIHKTKDKRINQLTEDLWHANRRADDLDRRWNELARGYEQIKADLERTGAALVGIQQQKSYRTLLKIIAIAKGRPILALVDRVRSNKKVQT
jgi:septal ring factor EnvC (AmiA/AmiB activator)